jgi:hypothetical protein
MTEVGIEQMSVRDGAQHVLKRVTEVITEVVFELVPQTVGIAKSTIKEDCSKQQAELVACLHCKSIL